jgi:hypothetical protein
MINAKAVAKYTKANMESGVKPPHSKSAVSRKRQSEQRMHESGAAGMRVSPETFSRLTLTLQRLLLDCVPGFPCPL